MGSSLPTSQPTASGFWPWHSTQTAFKDVTSKLSLDTPSLTGLFCCVWLHFFLKFSMSWTSLIILLLHVWSFLSIPFPGVLLLCQLLKMFALPKGFPSGPLFYFPTLPHTVMILSFPSLEGRLDGFQTEIFQTDEHHHWAWDPFPTVSSWTSHLEIPNIKISMAQTTCIMASPSPNQTVFLFPLLVTGIIIHSVTEVRKPGLIPDYCNTFHHKWTIIKSHRYGLPAIYWIILYALSPDVTHLPWYTQL